MQFNVTFRHMDASDRIRNYAYDRLQCIKKYFPDPIAVNVVLSTERYKNHVDVNLQLHNGFKIAGHEATEDMFSSIDLVAAKIERQVRRYKGKLQNHKSRSNYEPVPFVHTVLEDQSEAEAPHGEDTAADEPKVVRTEEFHADPLTAAEAVMQLNLLHRQFLVFRNSESGQVNVIYRRDPDSYGLIDPGSGTA